MDTLKTPQRDEREQTEQELVAELQAAGEVYLAAATKYAKLSRELCEMLDRPDSVLALHEAATNEEIAFEKYSEALDTFMRLMIQSRPSVLSDEK